MAPRKPEVRNYHHGDLHKALLKAATEELAEKGVEGFTLRSCARRAGVSHAAPAHHFGDVTGLLTEVATDAFDRLAVSIRSQVARTGTGSVEHVIAVALGYVLFAIASPAEFKLMFRTERLDPQSLPLRAASQRAISEAARSIGARFASDAPMSDPALTRLVVALWSLAHGVASLLLAGQLGPVGNGPALARALVPDMVRQLLGEQPMNAAKDMALIARTSALQSQ